MVTTLHGTDITLVGSDPASCRSRASRSSPATRSPPRRAWLREATYATLTSRARSPSRSSRTSSTPIASRPRRGARAAPRPRRAGPRLELPPGQAGGRTSSAIFARVRAGCPARASSCGWSATAPSARASSAGARAGARRPRALPRRARRLPATCCAARRLPAAQRDRELRPGRAGGDGLRCPVVGLARRRPARGGHRRRDRPARARRRRPPMAGARCAGWSTTPCDPASPRRPRRVEAPFPPTRSTATRRSTGGSPLIDPRGRGDAPRPRK